MYPSETLYPPFEPKGSLLTIPTVFFNYCTLSAALDSLTARANDNGTPFYWTIDKNKQFWFVPYGAVTNPTVINGTTLEQLKNPVIVTQQSPLYRNTQYVTGGVVQTSTQTETRIGDSNTKAWTMSYDLASASTITVNDVAQTVGIKGVDIGKNFYWQKWTSTITQDPNGTKLTNSQTIRVVYIGQHPSVFISQDAGLIAEQQAIEGGTTTGIVESVLNDQTISSADEGFTYAASLASRYGVYGTALSFYAQQSGFEPGQSITVELPDHELGNDPMLIESVTASDQVDNLNIWYNVNAVIGPYDTTWVDFFGRLINASQQASLSVGSSSTVVIVQQFSITRTPTATLTVVVDTPPNPSETLYPPFTI